jgi:hypothetical protein
MPSNRQGECALRQCFTCDAASQRLSLRQSVAVATMRRTHDNCLDSLFALKVANGRAAVAANATPATHFSPKTGGVRARFGVALVPGCNVCRHCFIRSMLCALRGLASRSGLRRSARGTPLPPCRRSLCLRRAHRPPRPRQDGCRIARAREALSSSKVFKFLGSTPISIARAPDCRSVR